MPCIPYRSKDGQVTGFICTRGPRERHYCTCGRQARYHAYPVDTPDPNG